MASPSCSRSLSHSMKRLKLSPSISIPTVAPRSLHQSARTSATPSPSAGSKQGGLASIRLPLAVQATYLAPLKRQPTHNITSADLQLRSYSVRNLDLFTDFAMRAAYYLNLPAKGPMPLPKKTERWTVPRSNFVHKKSQENFERITLRRWIRIVDGHPETVAIWLAFLRKFQYYGVGLKADVWENGSVDTVAEMDGEAERIRGMMGEKGELEILLKNAPKKISKTLFDEVFKGAYGAHSPLSAAPSVPNANRRVEKFSPGLEVRRQASIQAGERRAIEKPTE
ncbi:related to ribosomal protein S10 [Ramularia collo-cygni]|uniref:Small ribosomal subunit protein uS10m n=1 Tax=Ramularia collo-cygni TaxID=112498 RepID=A0A2D3V4E0_9PEZI|nr:related to ribosomal protein S10 [Ramularia collo-cygni]CZT21545.1 related to ribosomal protein S10 [Ramularia collo-cygni]